jgi:diguanylate cyclase (GGDEF)-like protein
MAAVMANSPELMRVPPQAVIEVVSEPNVELFAQHLGGLTGLLRMALLSGVEMSLPTALHLVLDISQSVVRADSELMIYANPDEPGTRLQVQRGLEPAPPPPEENLLHAWVGQTAKPLLASTGLDAAMDAFLARMGARHAIAVPMFLKHAWSGSLQLYRVDGESFDVTEGRLLWFLSLLAENQLVRIQSMAQLTQVAYTDYLTGLRARGYFEEALEQEVHRAVRQSSLCGLLLIDLDNFKSINDRYGHHAGDHVLRQFARILTHELREVDTAARYGGDEFGVILPDTTEAGVRMVAHRIRDAVRRHAFRVPETDAEASLGLSIGVALCPTDERSGRQLLRAADFALYQAKQRGKDRPLFWRELKQAS